MTNISDLKSYLKDLRQLSEGLRINRDEKVPFKIVLKKERNRKLQYQIDNLYLTS